MAHTVKHTLTAPPEIPEFDRWKRYRFPNPTKNRTTILESWTRTTTLIDAPEDKFHLEAWKQRSVAKGLGLRPELVAAAAMLDVKADSTKLNAIVGKALDASGAGAKADLGTALHSMTESYDWTGSLDAIPEAYHKRMLQYAYALKAHGVIIAPDMIERCIVSTTYQAAGTFDRVVRLSDGSYCKLDLKTGSSLDFGRKKIAAQLAVYVDGFNDHGVWDGRQMTHPGFKVRTDFGLVAHLPSDSDGCYLYKVDLEPGREWAALALAVRGARSDKRDPFELLTGDPCVDPFSLADPDAGDSWEGRLAGCNTVAELLAVMGEARAKGAWNERLANWARSYAKAIEMGAGK